MPDVYHTPVMLNECMEALCIKPSGSYIDLTLGGGGHCRAILERLGPEGRILAFDQDPDAAANVPSDERVSFANGNFRYLLNYARYYGFMGADGILCDLGVSSHHFDTAERGFSFRLDGPLDMRMNPGAGLTAAKVVNEYDEERLAGAFYYYGEFKNSRRIAAALCRRRAEAPIESCEELAECLRPFCGKDMKKDLARMFQALRIEVNDEMGALKSMLSSAARVLAPGGRLAIMSYHSIEDRIVKNFMRSGSFSGEAEKDLFGNTDAPFRPAGKALTPTDAEIETNPRSRSARLRIAERI